ncbi:MAG: acyl-CoA desaturase, partial [Polyangiales bacterium]
MNTPNPVVPSPIAAPERLRGKLAQRLSDYEWREALPFAAVHLAVLAAFWTGANPADWICCAVLYWVRMFGVTGVYHRYFSHRSYKTSRVMQFLLAWLAQSSAQKGVLWWAAHHRDHHRYSDTERDVHSPRRCGFWHAHMGWLFDHTMHTNYERIADFARYPELRFLNRFYLLPPIVLGTAVWWFLGWSGLVIGFCLSTVLLWHGTFTINSLAHMIGRRRFDTPDDSRNSWLLAIITMGEGWHNNHHHYQASTRQGFRWWELDLTYYILKLMSVFRLVWDLREPPEEYKRSTPNASPGGPNALASVPPPALPSISAPAQISAR